MACKFSTKMAVCGFFKLMTILVCVILFFWNSLAIFIQYREGNYLIKTRYEPSEAFDSPTFIICRTDAYRNSSVYMASKDDYLKNTFNIPIVKMRIYKQQKKTLYVSPYYGETPSYESWEIYSIYRGRCRAFRFLDKLGTNDYYVAHLLSDTGYMLYYVNEGEDIYFHQSTFPMNDPDEVKIDPDTAAISMQLDEQRHVLLAGCIDEPNNKRMTECFKECYVRELINTTCNPFWAYSMATHDLDAEDDCSVYSTRWMVILGNQVANKCIKDCKIFRSCRTNSYKAVFHQYNKRSRTAFFKGTEGVNQLFISFPADYRTIIEQKTIISFNDFISGIGGNLGLFLGFSLIGVLYGLYGYINDSCKW